ncbi:MAG: ABC transporter ATP-binding protein [Aigarchaeota archaeon]|nr:ABC transporter ATP-binding protein [Aigarchaeota archaeon]MDW8092308.1 ABC transporter ATP-binding protein [Nitrososphaerota archaeon]
MSEIAIEATRLYKTYDGLRWALEDFSLKVMRGQVVSLLGRNGAGKTTFVRIAATQLRKTKGELRVLGYDVEREAKMVRERVAVVPQESHPLHLCTPWEHVYYYLNIRGIGRSEARERARSYLKDLELSDYMNVPASNLSGGLRRRVLVGMALASEADLLFLDEPTIGLDPVSKHRVWEVVRKSVREGRTVLLTTHDMEEAEVLSDSVAILEAGRVLASFSVQELKARIEKKMRVDLETSRLDLSLVRGYGRCIVLGSIVRVYTDLRGARELAEIAVSNGAKATISPLTLEDVFLEVVNRAE